MRDEDPTTTAAQELLAAAEEEDMSSFNKTCKNSTTKGTARKHCIKLKNRHIKIRCMFIMTRKTREMHANIPNFQLYYSPCYRIIPTHLEIQETEEEQPEIANNEMPEGATGPSSSTGPASTRAADAGPSSDSKIRESRRLLSTCTALPEDIRGMYSMRADCVVSHVTHRNHTLPHIQVRLPQGEKYQNKQPGLRSMCC